MSARPGPPPSCDAPLCLRAGGRPGGKAGRALAAAIAAVLAGSHPQRTGSGMLRDSGSGGRQVAEQPIQQLESE